MENKTPFDLILEVRRWRESLAQSPGFRTGDIDELETHLHDSVGKLKGLGLTEEEAFTLALHRIGSGPALAKEYGSVNAVAVWTDRLLWMLLGWASLLSLGSLLSSVAHLFPQEGSHPGIVSAFIWGSTCIVAGLIIKFLMRSDGRIPRVVTKLLGEPLKLALIFVSVDVVSILLRTLRDVLSVGVENLREANFVDLSVQFSPYWLWLSPLIFILARKRLRTLRA